jgi:hypothetical protein
LIAKVRIGLILTPVLPSSTARVGATTTSSVIVIAGKVCFQEAAKPISTAEIRR